MGESLKSFVINLGDNNAIVLITIGCLFVSLPLSYILLVKLRMGLLGIVHTFSFYFTLSLLLMSARFYFNLLPRLRQQESEASKQGAIGQGQGEMGFFKFG